MAPNETINTALVVQSNPEIDAIINDPDSSSRNILSLALKSLRLSKTNAFSSDVLIEEKRRRIIDLAEVANHDTSDDCWIVLFDRVYDVTEFLYKHIGGADIILEYAGRDATTAFRGHSKMAFLSLKQYEIGDLPEKERLYRRAGFMRCEELPE